MRSSSKLITFAILWLAALSVVRADDLPVRPSASPFAALGGGEHRFLPVEQAFQMTARQDGQDLRVQFSVTPGHYLYRNRFRFDVDGGSVILGQPAFNHAPAVKDDPEFGKVPVYHEDVLVTLKVTGKGDVRIGWQGCAEAGLCYPPQSQTVPVDAAASTPDLRITPQELSIPIPTIVPTVSYQEDNDTSPAEVIAPSPAPATGADPFGLGQRPLLAFATLWLLGLGLAFTPCVLPMLPIVAGIVARQHASNARQGFLLAFSYALGVAGSYGLIGALVALFGSQANISLWLQHPAVLILFAGLFIVLALSSFDIFHLQLPSSWQHRLDELSRKGKAGSYAGSAIMGFFSALVVSPCVSAPLAGVLISVSTTGNPATGFLALALLGFGLSTPLMVLGASEGRLMPKSGLWMNRVKQSFGLMMVGVAIGLLARLLPGSLVLFLWAVLAAGTGFWLNLWGGHWRPVWRTLSYICLLWSAALVAGAASGGDNPWQPLARITASPAQAAAVAAPEYRVVKGGIELDALLEEARRNGRGLMLDVSAEWCVSCRQMDREIFSNATVMAPLHGWLLVRGDVTENTPATRELLKRFGLFGPPAVLFFRNGAELPEARIVGETDAPGFTRHLTSHGL